MLLLVPTGEGMGTMTTEGCSEPLPDLCPGTLGPPWAANFLQKHQHSQALSLLSGTEALGCGAQREELQEDLQESAQVVQKWWTGRSACARSPRLLVTLLALLQPFLPSESHSRSTESPLSQALPRGSFSAHPLAGLLHPIHPCPPRSPASLHSLSPSVPTPPFLS